MSASTVKLDAALLKEIRAVKPAAQTLSAFVREAVERDVRRRQLRAAAERYQAMLADTPDEREDLEAWERAPLADKPRRKKA